MARAVAPGLPHHVTQRGNRRQRTFFDDRDYRAYIRFPREECRRFGVAICPRLFCLTHGVHFMSHVSPEF
tara:strand:- start:428 stop:637 length:210 start_codon:yes stop_codon:yes gene_type:complete